MIHTSIRSVLMLLGTLTLYFKHYNRCTLGCLMPTRKRWFAMSRDRLLPGVFSRVHKVHKTPHVSTWVAGLFVGIPAGIFDIGTLADLANIGTLFAFVLVSVGVILLRKRQPERPRAFRVPWAPLLPLFSVACCVVLMMSLPLETWLRFFVWLIIGLIIYYAFGRKHSEFA
jgi:basic amino acid/polyamine antiporter, APA family